MFEWCMTWVCSPVTIWHSFFHPVICSFLLHHSLQSCGVWLIMKQLAIASFQIWWDLSKKTTLANTKVLHQGKWFLILAVHNIVSTGWLTLCYTPLILSKHLLFETTLSHFKSGQYSEVLVSVEWVQIYTSKYLLPIQIHTVHAIFVVYAKATRTMASWNPYTKVIK